MNHRHPLLWGLLYLLTASQIGFVCADNGNDYVEAIVGQVADIQLKAAMKEWKASNKLVCGNLHEVDFHPRTRDDICIHKPASVFTGMLCRVDYRLPVDAFSAKYNGQYYLRKRDPIFDFATISNHLRVPTRLYTSTSFDHEGNLVYLKTILKSSIERGKSSVWVDVHTNRIVPNPFPDVANQSQVAHPEHIRILLVPQYKGIGTGIRSQEAAFDEEHEVTTLGFQPTQVRFLAFPLVPSDKPDYLQLEHEFDLTNLIKTRWKRLVLKRNQFYCEYVKLRHKHARQHSNV